MSEERIFVDAVDVPYKEPQGPLWEIAKTIPTVKKWHHYFETYEQVLGPRRNEPIKMLEIGVYEGGSLEMWKRYFHPDSVLVGIDIMPETAKFEADGINVRIGNQSDPEFLKAVVDEFGQFDVILDDGGHMTSQQNTSFVSLFRDGLKDGGVYIVEDLHSNFWQRYIDSERTFMFTLIQLVELMHSQYYWRNELEQFDIINEDAHTTTMEYYEAWIKSIQFFDSIAVINKGLRSAPVTPFMGGVK